MLSVPAFHPKLWKYFTAGLLACLVFLAFPPRLPGQWLEVWKTTYSLQLRGQLRTYLASQDAPDSLLIHFCWNSLEP